MSYGPDVTLRQAALNAILEQNGQGRVASNDAAWNGVVRPALLGNESARTQQIRDAWANRNSRVAAANSAMVGGYGSALNAERQQQEQEWLRKYLASQTPTGGGGGGGGGGGDKPSSTLPMPEASDPWAWVEDYATANMPGAAPSPKKDKPVPMSNPGGGRGGKPSVGKPKPAGALPTVKRY